MPEDDENEYDCVDENAWECGIEDGRAHIWRGIPSPSKEVQETYALAYACGASAEPITKEETNEEIPF